MSKIYLNLFITLKFIHKLGKSRLRKKQTNILEKRTKKSAVLVVPISILTSANYFMKDMLFLVCYF